MTDESNKEAKAIDEINKFISEFNRTVKSYPIMYKKWENETNIKDKKDRQNRLDDMVVAIDHYLEDIEKICTEGVNMQKNEEGKFVNRESNRIPPEQIHWMKNNKVKFENMRKQVPKKINAKPEQQPTYSGQSNYYQKQNAYSPPPREKTEQEVLAEKFQAVLKKPYYETPDTASDKKQQLERLLNELTNKNISINNIQIKDGYLPKNLFQYAVQQKNSREILALLVDKGITINDSLVNSAIDAYCSAETIEFFIDQKVTVSDKLIQGAIQAKCSPKIIEDLITAKANKNEFTKTTYIFSKIQQILDKIENDSLDISIQEKKNYLIVINNLIKNNPELLTFVDNNENQLFHYVVKSMDYNFIKEFLEQHPTQNLNMEDEEYGNEEYGDEDRKTPLEMAIDQFYEFKHINSSSGYKTDNERIRIVQMLIQKGCSVNSPLANGSTPLHRAIERNHIPLIEALIASGADINLKDTYGKTPLHLVIEKKPLSKELMEKLILAGATIPKDLNKNQLGLIDAALAPSRKVAWGKFPRQSDPISYMSNFGLNQGQMLTMPPETDPTLLVNSIENLIKLQVIERENIGQFLYDIRGYLRPTQLGNYLALPENKKILNQYMNNISFKDHKTRTAALIHFDKHCGFDMPDRVTNQQNIINALAKKYITDRKENTAEPGFFENIANAIKHFYHSNIRSSYTKVPQSAEDKQYQLETTYKLKHMEESDVVYQKDSTKKGMFSHYESFKSKTEKKEEKPAARKKKLDKK